MNSAALRNIVSQNTCEMWEISKDVIAVLEFSKIMTFCEVGASKRWKAKLEVTD